MKRSGILVLGLCLASAAGAATFTVTNTNDTGPGSLRQAINDANDNAGADTIDFAIPGSDSGCDGSGVCTITPVLPFASLNDPVTIDGFTQTGAAPNTNAEGAINAVLKIVISGDNLEGSNGIIIASNDVTVQGLVVNGPWLFAISSNLVDNVSIRGCFIGVDAAGAAAAGASVGFNGHLGTGIVVGGPAAADRNLISGNTDYGVKLERCTDCVVQGNLIGTDPSGGAAIGAGSEGLRISVDSPGTVVRENVVAAADDHGINVGQIGSDTLFGVSVLGNWVGTDVNGTAELGNGRHGIVVNTNQVTVGGLGPGEGNVVAFNRGAGVIVLYATETGQNPIRGNSIYSNGLGDGADGLSTLGIDLGDPGVPDQGGPTPNDLGDGDEGPNGHQNFPLIASAVSNGPQGTSTTIQGTLDSTPGTQFEIDFYAVSQCLRRPQGFREGQTYIGTDSVTTDGSGHAVINTVLPGIALGPGDTVSATATDAQGNTSEFSQRFVLTSNPGSGTPAGGIETTLSGFNFLGGATVTVGGQPATNVQVNSYTSIDATMPALTPGTVNAITVANTDGSASTLPNGWVADFLDVPGIHQFYGFVTTLVRNQITVGVGGGNYGVAEDTKRQQMAVFILKGKFGLCYVPPNCTGVFADVPCPSTFANWIEALADEGITGGCGGNNYCPLNPVRRDQMAVFLLKAKHGSGYVPPPCDGDFADVPCPGQFADWIEQLAAEQITGGCGGNNYCPLANNTRGQMAVFIVKTFNLE
jgi:Right handed beta helix region/IPT/TIG domain/S-layer homology domain